MLNDLYDNRRTENKQPELQLLYSAVLKHKQQIIAGANMQTKKQKETNKKYAIIALGHHIKANKTSQLCMLGYRKEA